MQTDIQNFDFHAEHKSLTAELSTLEGTNFKLEKMFYVRNPQTRTTVCFHFFGTETGDGNDDILLWEYLPSVKLPNLKKLVIFND